ncbi:MAG TPA: hypothetical protein VFX43_15440 [Chitinophagaceae bacterium]|nr:hypothetical protein [Chitinophagaceae bacterium]
MPADSHPHRLSESLQSYSNPGEIPIIPHDGPLTPLFSAQKGTLMPSEGIFFARRSLLAGVWRVWRHHATKYNGCKTEEIVRTSRRIGIRWEQVHFPGYPV